jgi:hypothetical protein
MSEITDEKRTDYIIKRLKGKKNPTNDDKSESEIKNSYSKNNNNASATLFDSIRVPEKFSLEEIVDNDDTNKNSKVKSKIIGDMTMDRIFGKNY